MAKRTRELILEKSAPLFREKGFAGTSMREIAAAAGIAVGNLCYYFPKKEDLYYSFYSRFFSALTEALEPIISKDCSPWVSFFAREYIIYYKFFADPHYRKQALDAINIPVFREHYCRDFYSRLIEFMDSIGSNFEPENLLNYSIVFCSTEMQLFEAHWDEDIETFNRLFSLIVRIQFNFAGVAKERQEELISEILSVSQDFLKNHPKVLTF